METESESGEQRQKDVAVCPDDPLASANAPSRPAPKLDARLFIMRVILQLTKQPALLQLLVKPLEGLVDRFVGVDVDLDQCSGLRVAIMAVCGPVVRPFAGRRQSEARPYGA